MLISEECINQFVNDYSFKLTRKTLRHYEITIRQLLEFCGKPINEINTRDVRNWLAYLNEEGYKQGTIKNKMFGLRLFYQYCLEEGRMTHNPVEAIPLPKDEDKLPHYLTYEQLKQLRSLCEGNVKHRAVIEMLYSTGVRISELTSMKLEDINWTERMILIQNGKGKKERIVLFSKECLEHLNAYLQNRSDNLPFVFLDRTGTGAIKPKAIRDWFVVFRKKLGIYLTPHTLRHTFAAHLAMKGMPLVCIQTLMGHDNPISTHLYARLHQQAQKQMYDEWM